jgi:23S rRNA (cytidine2498-2'-O)-methyltransferase
MPNRAYLKLWELFTVAGARPAPGETCLDLGASPGGWTWVLQTLGARVLSVDKAPLDPRIARLPGVEEIRESAFGLAPEAVGPVDWLFSDVVCYPDKLYGLVERWLASGLCRNLVCTLKFQGATDHAAARRFAAIPGSKLMHLYHNKHELTWFRPAP